MEKGGCPKNPQSLWNVGGFSLSSIGGFFMGRKGREKAGADGGVSGQACYHQQMNLLEKKNSGKGELGEGTERRT